MGRRPTIKEWRNIRPELAEVLDRLSARLGPASRISKRHLDFADALNRLGSIKEAARALGAPHAWASQVAARLGFTHLIIQASRRITIEQYRSRHSDFVEAFEELGSIGKAAERVGVSRTRGYQIASRLGLRPVARRTWRPSWRDGGTSAGRGEPPSPQGQGLG